MYILQNVFFICQVFLSGIAALLFSFLVFLLFLGSSTRIRRCAAAKWEKKHMPEAWKILSGMEEAYREKQLFCTEPNVHIHCMYYLKDSLPQ